MIAKALTPVLFVASVSAAHALDFAPPRCEYGEASPKAPAEMSQFAFLIGDFKIDLQPWGGEDWKPPLPDHTARWNGWYGLGGMAVVDEWYEYDPAQKPDAGRGINVRMYDEKAGEWDMMWIDSTAHQVQDLRAKMEDGKLVMWQVYPERPNFKAEFIIDDKDHWSRVGYKKNEDGEWVKRFKLAATRIPCPT